MSTQVLELIAQQVAGNPVVVYMKGSPQFPMCGFSSRTAEALKETGYPFSFVNILEEPEIMENLPKFANWPTFPQVYIGGELIGGCDITLELAQRDELKPMIEAAISKQTAE